MVAVVTTRVVPFAEEPGVCATPRGVMNAPDVELTAAAATYGTGWPYGLNTELAPKKTTPPP